MFSGDPLAQLRTTLADGYRIERELGGGGMSRVFLATEQALGREVVVKIIAPELAAGLSAGRFAREVKLAARLQQANIVPVLTAGEAGGLPYYTMPFVRGESLRVRIARGDAIPVGEAVGILRDVARALAYAHAEGVVHRDIKPENILLSGGTAVVTDFGIAKAVSAALTLDQSANTASAITQLGSAIGTPAYMAPEQSAGDPGTDHRADLYAWGMVAWELLAGRHPFAGRVTPQALLAAHLTEIPASLGSLRAEVPAGLSEIVRRCLEKHPDRRPGSAAELLAALDAPRPRRRSREFLVAFAVVAVTAVGGWLVTRGGNGAGAPAAAPPKSLAVLPFESVGGDTANAYFAEGIADELTTALAQVPGLRLAGRRSAQRFAGSQATMQEVGAALRVGSVLEGTVRRSGSRLRVSAQLTNAADGLVLWSETYERDAKDVFAVQDDITKAIVGALRVQLGYRPATAGSGAAATTDPVTYDLYLRGLYLYRRRGLSLAQSAVYFEQAIARDSGFARAHAALASTLLATAYFLSKPMQVLLPQARREAEVALRLAPDLADSHLAMGYVLAESYEWKGAEAELRRAVALDPANGEAQYRLGNMLLLSGRVNEAIVQLEEAKRVDPLYPLAAVYLAWSKAVDGRKVEAVAEARRALELDSTGLATLSTLSSAFSLSGQPEEAATLSRRAIAASNDPRRMGIAAAALPLQEKLAIIRRVEAVPLGTWGRESGLAVAYLSMGDTARALPAMERAAAGDGDLLLGFLPANFGDLALFRGNARFAAVMRRFNLDPELMTTVGRPAPK